MRVLFDFFINIARWAWWESELWVPLLLMLWEIDSLLRTRSWAELRITASMEKPPNKSIHDDIRQYAGVADF